MTELTAEQSKKLIGNSLVLPANKSAIDNTIKGVSYEEVAKIMKSLDVHNLDDELSQYKIKLVRIFVKKLRDRLKARDSYKYEVVNGLHKTKDDYTFITWTYQMREGLWN
jgi:hypothetical protein